LSDSAAKHRARQTVVNLVLALAASIALVALVVISVPRDESNRIKPVAYDNIVNQAKSATGLNFISIKAPTGWWCNLAQLNTSSNDAVINFKAGFVGSNTKYIGYTQAFDANPTWLAFKLNTLTPTGDYKDWKIYQSIMKNDPPKTNDYTMVLQYSSNNYVLLYGVADESELQAFADEISLRLQDGTVID
jgi:Protein of unknown function (DUF4245)